MFKALFLFLVCIPALAKETYVTLQTPPVTLKRGETKEVTIIFAVRKDYHIQANPASTPSLIPTQLILGQSPGVQPGSAKYPPGRPYRMQGADNDISVYSEFARIVVPISVLKNARPGKRTFAGNIRYQACNNRTCMFPQTDAFQILGRIVK